jgi:micrococcal nuclease
MIEHTRHKYLYYYKADINNVVDGDTVDALIDLGMSTFSQQRLRLLGIDTPERGEDGFDEARTFMVETVLGREVVIKTVKKDSFGRWIAEIFRPGQVVSVNKEMLDLKLAVPYRKR